MAMNYAANQAIGNSAILSGTSTTTTHPSTGTLHYVPIQSNPVVPINKAPEQFALWLLGVSDTVAENSAPSPESWDMIKKRLHVVIGTLAADRLMGNLE